MKNKIIFVIIFIIILSGFVYYSYTKNSSDKTEIYNVSIATIYDGKFIKTSILIDDIKINTSKTYEIIEVNNGLITVTNKNLNEQNFYEISKDYNISENTRIDIFLEKPQEPILTINKKTKDFILFTVSSDNFKGVNFCLDSSVNYIFVTAVNYTEINKLTGFENYDKCYTGFDLIKDNRTILVTYSQVSEISDFDYINISFIDIQNNQKTFNIR